MAERKDSEEPSGFYGRSPSSESDRYMRAYEKGGWLKGHLEYMSEMPVLGKILDPGGFFRSDLDEWEGVDVPERLSPEVQSRMRRSVDLAKGLRDRPLVSGMKARAAGQQGLRSQAAARAGGSPEARAAMRQQGAGMGAKILGQYGGQMAGESVGRFNLGTKMAQAGQQLEQGQVIFALGEKLRNYLAAQGVNLNEQQAMNAAMGAAAGFAASNYGKGDDDDKDGGGGNGNNMGDYPPPNLPAGQAVT